MNRYRIEIELVGVELDVLDLTESLARAIHDVSPVVRISVEDEGEAAL